MHKTTVFLLLTGKERIDDEALKALGDKLGAVGERYMIIPLRKKDAPKLEVIQIHSERMQNIYPELKQLKQSIQYKSGKGMKFTYRLAFERPFLVIRTQLKNSISKLINLFPWKSRNIKTQCRTAKTQQA